LKRIKEISVFLLLFFTISGEAQDLEVGPFCGGSYYLGDLNPGKHFLNTQLAYGILVRYNIDTRWAVKLSGYRGTVKGNSTSTNFLTGRDLAFSSPVTDISAVVEFNFFPYFTGSYRNRITPYIYAGFSCFFFDPVSNGISLRSMGTEGQNIGYEGRQPYGGYSFSIPFGLGAKISIARSLGLQVFWEMHKTFTDYLDDASTTYYLDGPAIPVEDLEGNMSDPTRNHQPGMQRGNAKNMDWFAFFGVSVTYKFNLLSSKRCRDLNH